MICAKLFFKISLTGSRGEEQKLRWIFCYHGFFLTSDKFILKQMTTENGQYFLAKGPRWECSGGKGVLL